VALVIGSIIGLVSAQKVPMTAMPQMVAIFNGLGGAASALIAIGEYWVYCKVVKILPLTRY